MGDASDQPPVEQDTTMTHGYRPPPKEPFHEGFHARRAQVDAPLDDGEGYAWLQEHGFFAVGWTPNAIQLLRVRPP